MDNVKCHQVYLFDTFLFAIFSFAFPGMTPVGRGAFDSMPFFAFQVH
jgi:hypothetical protein